MYSKRHVRLEKESSFRRGFITAAILTSAAAILILLTSCNTETSAPKPSPILNTTFDLLTNGGTSKPWKLDSAIAEEGYPFEIDSGWYQADYTYYGHNLMTITHPRYNTITMDYILYLDSLVIFGYYANAPAILRFKIDNISETHLRLIRKRDTILVVTEYYIRK